MSDIPVGSDSHNGIGLGLRFPPARFCDYPRTVPATPIEYLLEIEHASFPVHVRDPEVIQAIAVLCALGCVEAEIYPPLDLRRSFGEYECAVVKKITPEGISELALEYS
ncbi:hypothetical protein ABID97_002983 [Variovorax sp. OAS795]|uniref:hypothetical protein n=1 Tax=Variovorax sp. OAS795 TaxID=3034231 RepID=UPI0033932A6E